MTGLGRDVRLTLRALRKAPLFTAATVLTLALGIGLTVTIFSAVNGVLLQPLPYAQPDRLANVWVDLGVGNQSLPAVSPFDFRDYQQRSRTFESFAAASGGNIVGASGVVTDGDGEPERTTVSSVTANFFPLLGVQPALGQHFEETDEAFQGPLVVMLSHSLWSRRYGADPALVGRTIQLDGIPHRVVGILPERFRLLLPAEAFLLQDSEIYRPLQFNYEQPTPRNFTFFTVFGRLKPEATWAEAQADMEAIARQLRAEYHEHESSDMRIRVVPLQQDVVKGARPALVALLGTVAFVLLIACANVAHLLLARGVAREREIAVRTALGASRWRVFRQLAVESLVLATAGGGAGLLFAWAALRVLRVVAPEGVPRIEAIQIDGAVLAFTVAVCGVTALLFGAAPAMHFGRTSPVQSLRAAASTSSASQARLRSMLVVAEIALSLVLVVGSGLMIRSFVGLTRVEPGFEPERTLTFQLALPRGMYANGAARRQFVRVLEEKLRGLTGVEAVGTTTQLPLTGSGPLSPYAYDDQTARNWESATADGRNVSPDYFRAMGTRLLAGRFFTEQDQQGVIIIDATLAARAFGGRNAVGERLQVSPTGSPNMYAEVVGVVQHVRMLELRRTVHPQIYRPLFGGPPVVAVAIRTRGTPDALAADVRAAVRALNPNLAIDDLQPMTAYVGDALASSWFNVLLMNVFGGTALLLAAVGIYGVIAYSITQRTREFGIRLALGEEPARIRRRILRDGMTLVGVSLAIGVPAAMLVARFLEDILYEVGPADLLTHATGATALTLIALVACYVPALRVMGVNPLVALRTE